MKIKILPKKRTPQVGITLRSISIWVGAVHGEVDVSWFTRSRRVNSNDKRTNLLLIPWPLELTPAAFSEVNSSRYRQFEYHPPSFATTQHLRALLRETKRMGLPIDGMIFPEQALLSSDFERLRSAVKKEAPDAFILAGVQSQGAKHPRNEAWLAVDNDVRKQEKHHRWSLTASQIRQYHLGGALHADDEGAYWERMTVGPRSIAFAHLKPRLTLCHLICEDLARVEPVAEVVRAVGPNLVIALLLDGPQLEKRWPGRYASIFADDPGSSVLTLSALGMVRRCVPVGEQESRVVALWKDALTGGHELSMASGVDALVLSLSTNFATERTFDGRQDERSTGVLAFSGLNEVRLKR